MPSDDVPGRKERTAALSKLKQALEAAHAESQEAALAEAEAAATAAAAAAAAKAVVKAENERAAALEALRCELEMVGRCRLTPGTRWFPHLTPRLLSGTFSS